MAPASRQVEVAIVGGGPAGIATALALGGRGATVFEATGYTGHRVGEVLPGRSFQPLQRLGAWESFLADGHLRSPGFGSSWQDQSLGHLDQIADPFGCGWHLDRRRFDGSLAELARDQGVDLLTHHRVTGCRPSPAGGHELTGTDASGRDFRITAAVVVDASGRSARLARRLGARRHAADRLVAVYGILDGVGGDRMTRIEAAEIGWWYLASLPGGINVAALFTDADLAHRQALSRPDRWSAELGRTRHVQAAMPAGAAPTGPLRVHAAQSSILRPAQGAGWIAVGDAALACDPLAAQGIPTALASGIQAGEALGRSMAVDDDFAEQRQAALEARFAAFLRQRQSYYAMVRRWPGAPFWQRRNGAIA